MLRHILLRLIPSEADSVFCAFAEILKTVHESVVKLWFVFLLVCQESKILVKFGETDNASELWIIQYKKEHSFDTVC